MERIRKRVGMSEEDFLKFFNNQKAASDRLGVAIKRVKTAMVEMDAAESELEKAQSEWFKSCFIPCDIKTG